MIFSIYKIKTDLIFYVKSVFVLFMKHSLRSREAKHSFLYKNQWRSHCISSILQKLYIITALPCISSLRKPSLMQSFVERLMRYNNGDAVVDDIHASRDDMPLLSQWIKKSKSLDLDFLVWMNGLEPTTPCMSSPPNGVKTPVFTCFSLCDLLYFYILLTFC